MLLSAGARLGPYEVVAQIGAGGMGEVYRARDTKLGRQVAVKVLPESLAAQPDRVARFEHEARVLASLNHPHIAALYGMEEADRRHFLVMELVEGETLAERLRRGPIPVEGALRIAHQIAEALEAAHEKGVVHRDLKPANVMNTPDERVKVLDFGLAKALEPVRPDVQASSGNLTNSPTLNPVATEAGVILGTAAYMSPEQAQGLAVDHRSDIFSFGSVLYEMLTGRQSFQGDTAGALMASVLAREPDLMALPANLNPRISELIRRCLEKNPKRRWQAVGDLRAEIETIAAAPRAAPTGAVVSAPPKPLWKRAMPVAAAAILVGTLGVFVGRTIRSPESRAVARFPISLGEGQRLTSPGRNLVAISPDGTRIVYVANARLYLRSISELEARPIPGSEDAQNVTSPVFSPDGLSVAFFSASGAALKRIAIGGGTAVTLCPAVNPSGVSWGADGIVFGQGSNGILRVSPDAGKPELLARVSDDEWAHGPQMMPGGDAVLFTIGSVRDNRMLWDRAKVVLQDLSTMERTVLIDGASDARYVPTGHLVYAVGGVLFAMPFDERRRQATGSAVPVVEGVRRTVATGTAHFTFSNNGTLVYLPGPVSTTSLDLAWVGRGGGITPLKVPAHPYEFPRISPTGRRLAVGTDDGKNANVWIHDLADAASMRQLTLGGRNRYPIWSSDGARIAFQSDREGDLAIYWQRADGSGAAERLTKPELGTSHVPDSWSPKSDRFLFTAKKGSDISLWTFTVHDRTAAHLENVQSSAPPRPVFSPDGRWLAYGVVQSGAFALFVQPFPTTGAKSSISTGYHPLWSPDGKALYFSRRPGLAQTMVMRIATRPSLTLGNPEPVLRATTVEGDPGEARNYDLTPDGQRFLIVVAPDPTSLGLPAAEQLQVVLNWFEELKRRVPAK